MMYVYPGIHGASVVHDGQTIDDATKAQGIAVEALPECNTPEGKVASLWANDQGEIWWEYDDIPVEPVLE